MAEPTKISQFDVAELFGANDFLSAIQQTEPGMFKNVRLPKSVLDAMFLGSSALNDYYTKTDSDNRYGRLGFANTWTENQIISKNLTVTGDFTVNGTRFISNTEIVEIKDNLAIINYGEVGNGITAGFAGWQIDRGTADDFLFGFTEVPGFFQVGKVGAMQTVATREDVPTNNYYAKWNSTLKRFDTAIPAFSEIGLKPTTLNGYGITDAYTKVEGDGRYGLLASANSWAATQTITGSLVIGTQANKVTITYATNTARTLTIPNVAGNRTFSFINQAETISAIKTFSANPVLSAATATLNFSSTTGNKTISTGGTTNLVLTPGGGVAIKQTTVTTGFVLDVNGNVRVAGNFIATGEVTGYSSSDCRLKENINPILSSLEMLEKINPVSFNWNSKAKELNPSKSSQIAYGVIAQELKAIMPELVGDIYNDYLGVDYVQLIPILIGAIKELNNRLKKAN